MELFLLNAVAFLRPIGAMEFAEALFEILAIVLFVLIVGAFVFSGATRKSLRFDVSDGAIAAISLWCIAIYIIYFERAHIGDLAKLLIPLISFTVAKNIIRDCAQYRLFVLSMILGFVAPIVMSAVVIAGGGGIEYVTYWTGVPRWKGIYANSHNFGHSMTLFLILLTVYGTLTMRAATEAAKPMMGLTIFLALVGALALFCLYKSQVRSAMVGLIVFAALYLYFVNKKALVVGIVALGLVATVFWQEWLPALAPDVVMIEKGQGEVSDLGSSRPKYWAYNVKLFLALPLDEQLAGVGFGNVSKNMDMGQGQIIDSHNDWLDLLIHTGVVGFGLFLWIQILILRMILKIKTEERYVFLAMFVAVTIMMFTSNSYLWRIQVSHLYYMALAFLALEWSPHVAEG
jgi:hypothetical protein